MKRKIIEIDESRCDGCGDCVQACHEGAIQLIDGKAKLVSDSYCDGLGDCIGECPQGAITIVEREAGAFDEEAVQRHLEALADRKPAGESGCSGGGCPGSALRSLAPESALQAQPEACEMPAGSQLGHWPVQIRLIPPHAPFLQGADLLICADCCAFVREDLHARYLKGKAVLVGCPKLDDVPEMFERFQAIFETAKPRSVTVLRMEVPCCGGIVQAAVMARQKVAPTLPLRIEVFGVDGRLRQAQELEPGAPPS